MDLSKLSDADLMALQSGDLSKLSDAGLSVLSGKPVVRAPDALDRQMMESAKVNPALKTGAEVLGGATSMLRGGANIVGSIFGKTKWGQEIWPTEGLDKGSLAYTAGEIADPASWLIGGTAGKVVGPLAAKAGSYAPYVTGAVSGGVAGGITGGLSEDGDAGTGAGVGTAVGVASPMLGNIVRKGGGWVNDVVRGRAGQVKAGQIARAAAGERLPAIRQAMSNADPSVTAAQAGESVKQPMWSSLGKVAESVDQTGYYYNIAQDQAAARAASLRAVTPDLKAAEAARSATMTANMAPVTQNAATVRAAQEATMMPPKPIEGANPFRGVGGAPERTAGQIDTFPAVPALEALKGNPVITAMIADARRMAASRKNLPEEFARLTKDEIDDIIKDPTKSVNGLRLMKAVIDNRFKNPESTASVISKMSDGEAAAIKSSLMGAAETAAPGWSAARQQFGQMSAPVNQSRVLGELSSVLDDPKLVGERTGPFLNALGRGEDTALGRAGLNTRFGGIEDVLSAPQMAAVDSVKNQLVRDASIRDKAVNSAGGLRDVIDKFTTTFKLPGFMSRETTAFNKVLEMSEKYLSENTKKALVEGMRSGKSAAELLDTLPTSERNKFLMIVGRTGEKAAPYLAAQAGSME